MSAKINTIEFWRGHLLMSLVAVLIVVGLPDKAEADYQIQVWEALVASARSAEQAASINFNRVVRAHANGQVPFAEVQKARNQLRAVRKALKEKEARLHILRARAQNRQRIYRNNGYRWNTGQAGQKPPVKTPVEPNSHRSNTYPGCSVCAYNLRVIGLEKFRSQ